MPDDGRTTTTMLERDERHEADVRRWPAVEALEVRPHDERIRHDVVEDGFLDLQSLLIRRPGSDVLVVHLHGSIERQHYELPRFERLSSLQEVDANLLLLADPTLLLDDQLRIGWYLGREGEDATARLAALVRRVAAQLGVARIVLAGSSAGGFGAIALAPRIPGALAVAFSPQVHVRRFGEEWAERLRSAAFPSRERFEDLELDPGTRARVDLAALYDEVPGGRVWYVQNSGDVDHVALQRDPFEAAVDDRVTFVDEFHCAGHNPPTRTRVRAWIERALEAPDEDPRSFALPAA